jgi:hypothetical protein
MTRTRLLGLAAIAIGIWLVFAVLAVTALSPATRLLTFGLVTGALIVVGIYEMNKKDRNWKQAVLLLTATWLVCGATLYAVRTIRPREEPKGPLVAANDVTPALPCKEAKLLGDELLMIVGHSAVIGRGKGPFTPFRVGSCPALSITRTAQGLMVNAFGYDSDNNVVYRIRDNVFDQVVGGFLTEHRPDRSSLVIGDDHGPRVLEIRYLNRNAVRISGTFRCGDSLPVHVSADGAFAGRIGMEQNRCVALHESPSGLEFTAATDQR